jgi:hypothetical protein
LPSAAAAAQPGQQNTPYNKLSQIFEPDIQGAAIAYIEHILGPAKKIFRADGQQNLSVRVYQVGPCRVAFPASDTVSSAQLENLSSDCNFDFKKILRTATTRLAPLARWG